MPESKPAISVSVCISVDQSQNREVNVALYPNTTNYPNGNPTETGSWPMSIELASGTTFIDNFSIIYPDDNRGNSGGNYKMNFSLPDGFSFAAGPGEVAVPDDSEPTREYEDGIAWLTNPGAKKQLTAKIKQGELELTFKKATNEDWADWRYQFAFVVEDSSGVVTASPDPQVHTSSDGANPP